jgi:hypothetical protein
LWPSHKGVFLDLATQAETGATMLHSPNDHAALQLERRLWCAKTFRRKNNLAFQAFASLESLVGDTKKSLAAEIFCYRFDGWSSHLAEQTHWPMDWHPHAFSSITSEGHVFAISLPAHNARVAACQPIFFSPACSTSPIRPLSNWIRLSRLAVGLHKAISASYIDCKQI